MRSSHRLAVALLAAGCAVSGPGSRGDGADAPARHARTVGRVEARWVADTFGLYDDPSLTAYVAAVGERLAAHAERGVAYGFAVVDLGEPNAFALPGGWVYVSRGLLALMNAEDELAGVLGHEIGHVDARHAAHRVTRAPPPALGGLPPAPYTAAEEGEADRIGQELSARAGWDPAGLSRLLETLARESRVLGDAAPGRGFLATHPPLAHRVAATETRAVTLRPERGAPFAPDRSAFVRRLAGLPVGSRAADGVLVGDALVHPALGFRIRFPPGWKAASERTAAVAVAPDGGAGIGVEVLGAGDDPALGLVQLERESGAELASSAEPFTVAGLPAVRAATVGQTPDGVVAMDLAWVSHAGRVYRLTGMAAPAHAGTLRAAFRRTVATFRPITAAEAGRLREARLALVQARAGERLADVLDRAGGTWTVEMAAVANGLAPDTVLAPGTLVKVPVSQPVSPGARGVIPPR